MQLKPSLETLRLEALANPFEMLNPVVKAQLTAFSKNTSESFRTVGTKLLSLTKIYKVNDTLKFNVVKQQLSKSDYVEHTSIMLPVPEGLNIPLADYIDLLSNAWAMSRDFSEKSIDQVDTYLSTIISYPGRMGIVEETSMMEAIHFSTDKIEATKLTLDKAFDTKKPRQSIPYGELFERDKDFELAGDAIMSLAKDYGTRDNKKLTNKVNQLAEKASLLHTRVKQGKLNITTKTAENIASVLHQSATALEFYAALSQLIEEMISKFVTILEVTDTEIKDLLNKK